MLRSRQDLRLCRRNTKILLLASHLTKLHRRLRPSESGTSDKLLNEMSRQSKRGSNNLRKLRIKQPLLRKDWLRKNSHSRRQLKRKLERSQSLRSSKRSSLL